MNKIGIYTGYWSTNIGNSFFQLGAEYVIKKAFNDCSVFPIGDEPGYIKPARGNASNAYNPLHDLDFDYVVILGPFIRPEFFKILAPTLEKLQLKGTKVIALGVGMMDYKTSTISAVREFLKKYPPLILSTRDSITFEAFKKDVPLIYDGFDLGFFVSDIMSDSPRYTGKKYVTLNFDQIPEPDFIPVSLSNSEHSINIGDEQYIIKFNKFRKRMCERGFYYQLIDRLFFIAKKTSTLGGYSIVRTDHRYNPVLLQKIYISPNTYSGDVPFSYFQIYKNAEITFSNRVHACVAALAFGNKAMLFSKSPRAHLLEKVGALDIKKYPVSINNDNILSFKENLISFIKNSL